MNQRRRKTRRTATTSEAVAAKVGASPPPSRTEQQDAVAELLTALVLGCIAMLRPWRDGMAFPAINDYYLWVQAALFALVAARMLVRREALRFPLLVILFAAFLGVAFLTTLDTVQYNNSYRTLIVWAGHFFLFAVAAQTLRQPRSFAIVLAGFVAGAFAEAAFSVMHLKYYIPLVRDRVKMDPTLVQRYFSAAELNPEIARRLNTNRAFGTFLFPNALAGYMVLCVPFALGASAYSIRTLRALLKRPDAPSSLPSETAAIIAAIGSAATAVIAYTALSLFQAVAYRDDPVSAHWLQWTLWVGLLPVGVGTILYLVTKEYGLLAGWWTVASCVLPCFAAAAFLALVYSFSRGGMLAFLAGTAFTGCLLYVLLRKPRLLPRRWAAATFLLLAGAALVSSTETPATAAPSPELVTEGVDMTASELANPATMFLRATYWRTALSMIADNFWAGVGPGNFGAMYPRYKYVTAGETQHAHNDYLQIFAETGVFGVLTFCAFWGVFMLHALRRLIQMRNAPRLWLAAGLFAGVFAFLLHAVVDFDFVNPSLAGTAFLLAAIFCAVSDGAPERSSVSPYTRPMAAVFLAGVAVVLAASIRVHRADALAGTETDFRSRLLTAQFFVSQPSQRTGDRQGARIPVRDAVAFVPDLEALRRCGAFWVIEPGKTPRQLGPHEPLRPDVDFGVTDPEAARKLGVSEAENALARLKEADAIFPHDPIRAVHISEWCALLSETAASDEARLEWSNQSVEWARKALERSPHEAWFHEQYAAALWSQAQIKQPPQKQLETLFKSLEHYEQSTVLFPSSPVVWDNYARVLRELGNIVTQSGETQQGETLQKKAGEMAARAQEIRVADYHANRRRAGLE